MRPLTVRCHHKPDDGVSPGVAQLGGFECSVGGCDCGTPAHSFSAYNALGTIVAVNFSGECEIGAEFVARGVKKGN